MRTIEPSHVLMKNMCESSNLKLRALVASDKEKVCVWISSPFIVHYSFVVIGPQSGPREINNKDFAERYFNILMSGPRRQTFAILWHENIIGTVGIKDINNLSADCFIDIGDEQFRGQGLGYLAMTQLLNRVFYSMELNDLSLDVLEFNKAALKLYENLGFESQNCWTWHYDEFGIYWRVIRMSIPKHKWLNRSTEHV